MGAQPTHSWVAAARAGLAAAQLQQVQPRGAEAAALVEADRVGVGHDRADQHVVDALARELLVDRVEQRGAEALAAGPGVQDERLDLRDAVARAPRVGHQRLLDGRDRDHRVAEQRAVALGEQGEAALAEEAVVERAAGGPGVRRRRRTGPSAGPPTAWWW